MFVSSVFDVFASKPVQESVHETVYVVYKPIASVEQSYLEFLIPAYNENYIDPDIKVYIRGKLTKIDGTAHAIGISYLLQIISYILCSVSEWYHDNT